MSVGEEGKRRPNQLYYLYLYLVHSTQPLSVEGSDYELVYHHGRGTTQSHSNRQVRSKALVHRRRALLAPSAPATAACFGISVLVHRSEVPDPDTGKRDLHNVERCVETRGEYSADETAAERLHRRLERRGRWR